MREITLNQDKKLNRCGMITVYTTLYQRQNDTDINKCQCKSFNNE